MKNEKLKSRCPECSHELEDLDIGCSSGVICRNCGWSVVTTNLSKMLTEPARYEIRLVNGDHRNLDHLTAVAHSAGINFLEARKLLQGPSGSVIYSGRASEIIKVAEKLNLDGLNYEIVPPCPCGVTSAVSTVDSEPEQDE